MAQRARRDIVTGRRDPPDTPSRSVQATATSGDHALEDLLRTLREERGFAADTLLNRGRMVRPFLAWLADRGQLWQATTAEDITAYLADHPWWSRATIAQHVQTLRSFFRHGAARGWCRACVAEQIDAPRLYTHKRLPQGPTWHQVQQLLYAEVDLETKTRMLATCHSFGDRIGETKTRWRDDASLMQFLRSL